MARRGVVIWLLLAILPGVWAYADPAQKPDKPNEPAESKAPASPKQSEYELLKVLVDTLDQIDRNYVKEIDRRELIEAAIQGMLSKLDPYSSYIAPADTEAFRTSVDKEFGGIGIQLDDDSGPLRVLSPLVGTPAYREGILAGDRIVEIDGHSTDGLHRDDAIRLLKGPPGTQVTITMIHLDSTEHKKITIEREMIHVDTVMGYRRKASDQWDFMLDAEKHIGFIRVTAFSRETSRDLRKALEELKKDHLRGLILDLRFNPGGLLPAAIDVSRLFISKGRIVSTAGRNSPERVWEAHSSDAFEGFPMVVLVNRFSASASEITAGCLQDHHRALIVGERTWGKGCVQNVIEMEGDQGILKLTTANYLRPSGRNINRARDAKDEDEWGVTPDSGYLLKLNDRELTDLLFDRRQRDIVHPHGKNGLAGTQAQASAEKPQGKAAASTAADKPKTEPTPPKKANAGGTSVHEAKSTEKSPAGAAPAKPADAPSTDPEQPQPDPNGETAFVDRQLHMAIDYLTAELARAEKP